MKRFYLTGAIGLTVLFQILSLTLVLLFHVKELNIPLLMFAVLLILFTFVSVRLVDRLMSGDSYLILIVNMLFSIGVIMIYRIKPALGERQLLFYAIAVVSFFVVYILIRQSPDFWKDKTLFYYVATLFLFAITLLFGLTHGGARNWIELFGIQIQPSEFAKIPFVFFIAAYYANAERYSRTVLFGRLRLGSAVLMAATYVLIGLFFIQRELGTAVVFLFVLLAAQFAFEKNRRLLYGNLALAAVGLTAGYFLFDHVRTRFEIWIDPWSDIADKGYQITQSLFALAEGGFFGSGIGLGSPGLIPLGHSDFIFAAIVEEMGAFMGVCVMLLFLILFYRGVKISMRQSSNFYSALALLVSVMFAAQGIIMFAGVMKLIPLTGITIPFLTYGGSSLLSSFILLGALQVASEDLRPDGEDLRTDDEDLWADWADEGDWAKRSGSGAEEVGR